MTTLPVLEQFRLELQPNGLLHFVFDMPDRSMNVFSNKAIHELWAFADWLKTSDVKGVVVCSGKKSAFCAGADLSELGAAYDMIVAARTEDRFDIAYNHFFPLGHAIRKLETAGKPVAVAIAGLALGGGCELALGCHYRVLTTDKMAALGLPESLVGLFPGAGGTQRMPRIVGLEAGLDILLNGARLSGEAAVNSSLIHELVEPGSEIAACETWLLSDKAHATQPWDEVNYSSPSLANIMATTKKVRADIMTQTYGHFPAPLAILDCIEQGGHQPMDAAIRTEMSIFSFLIQRVEPRNMIQTMFVGKTAYDRAVKNGTLSESVKSAISELVNVVKSASRQNNVLRLAGFKTERDYQAMAEKSPIDQYWILNERDENAVACRKVIQPILYTAKKLSPSLTEVEKQMVDYAVVSRAGFPAYLGGPLTLAASGLLLP